MAKEIRDLRKFLLTARRPDAKRVTIVKLHKKPRATGGGASTVTKFKIRCSRYLYTFVVEDREKAQKLEGSLPPSLQKVSIPGKK
ncbi:60S ribosomal protein L38, related [Neospora caninum Liverpool]|uniref:60S ribosomal protein L38, related n=1 Tax=Neospora caninum (strain Liverpool) TaxID=572307 RepID=F0VHZ6_NEOCL|nr:60S ribosomal protein L38, related [Neospora caninum Liverpool]CBZ53357.1 60S ribosomal protein L38, related [Neospora caninum Liverpool]CEL67343.1 TPA: 60S ribosomal protein L38, related [Neospora caninum Liverpool]|eukprot:XP_003883389.1 60S ribosomal protein L38, related [Neospora caninum Liverpool]